MISIGLVLFFVILQEKFNPRGIDQSLVKVANGINKTCPFMIDSITRLDNVLAKTGKTLQYNLTILNIETVDPGRDERMKNNMEPYILNTLRSSPDAVKFRDNDITLVFYYKNINGDVLFFIILTPDKYYMDSPEKDSLKKS